MNTLNIRNLNESKTKSTKGIFVLNTKIKVCNLIDKIMRNEFMETGNGKNRIDLQQYLKEYMFLKEGEVEKINFIKAKYLLGIYGIQLKDFNDSRLDNITIGIVPDNIWEKGICNSESNAKKNLILFKQSYFDTKENTDISAWMTHELAHCQKFLDSDTPEDYQKNMQKFAFEDLESERFYPNNPVEHYTFTKQFQFLKKQGKSKSEIFNLTTKNYNEKDFPFFYKVLDKIFN